MSDQPIQPEQHLPMNVLANIIDEAINGPPEAPRKWGFALLVYAFGEPGRNRMNYIGNGRRDDMLVAFKELVARWEGRVTESDTKQ